MSKSKCKRGIRGRSRVWSANLAARRPPARLSSSPPAEPASAEEEPKQVFGGRVTGWMGAWALLGGGSRNGGGKLERGGVSEPKPRAPPAPAHVNPTAAARACVRNSGEARARAVACARGPGAARVRLGVWPCAGDVWRGSAASWLNSEIFDCVFVLGSGCCGPTGEGGVESGWLRLDGLVN